ncbi:MAG: hypothetical protein WC941_01150 [Candidatus Bathyarchaeia archaeon]
MVSKTVVIVIVVLVAGSLLGYGFGLTESSGMLDRVTALENELNALRTDSEAIESQLSALTAEKGQLETQLATSTTGLESLTAEYNSVLADYTALSLENTQLQESYDALNTKYQALIGGPIGSAGDSIAKTYIWSFGGKVWTVELQVPKTTLDYFRNHARLNGEDYSVYITNSADDAYMTGVANKLRVLASQEGYTGAREVNFVASFVQSMPYEFDNVTTGYQEYARYPLETLVDGRGDCECKSILTAELLDLLGYKLALISLPSHTAVGVDLPNGSGSSYTHDGVAYFYLETTHTGWLVGDMPPAYYGVSASLYPVVPVEIVSLSFTYRYVGAKYTVNATVYNRGTATASGYTIATGFDAGGGMIWSKTESPKFDVTPDSWKSIILTLEAPSSTYTRMLVYLVSPEGYSVETQYSGWFNT